MAKAPDPSAESPSGGGSTRRELFGGAGLATLAALGLAATASTGCATLAGSRSRYLGRTGDSPEDYMRMAIALAKSDIVPYGAVIVDTRNAEVVGVGNNQVIENITYHAEIVAIDDMLTNLGCLAGLRAELGALKHMAIYSTAESCPMCMSAIVWGKMQALYYGTTIPYMQGHGWPQIAIRAQAVSDASSFGSPTVTGGILEAECNALYPKLPFGDPRREHRPGEKIAAP